MKSSVKCLMLATAIVLVSGSGFPAIAASIRLGKGCSQSYKLWKDHGEHKAFFATPDGSHCGYSYGKSAVSIAKIYAWRSCERYSKDGVCVPVGQD